ncbi:MAG: response regulator [Myxococcota bacterium]|nr:response regulator [Myxococcota bacterium]
MEPRAIERVLVVEDSASLRRSLERVLAKRFAEVRGVSCVAEARSALPEWRPDLLLLDVELPDGTALDVMEALRDFDFVPLVIAMSGAASPSQSFELAKLGVRTYLPKPIELGPLEDAIRHAAENPPDLTPALRSTVGQRPIHEVEEEVRRTMLNEALGRSGGSRRAAARLLQVSRQLVQHMLRRHDTD